MTIFLNPLQFGPGEDLSRYPRTVDADLEICAARGRRPRLRADAGRGLPRRRPRRAGLRRAARRRARGAVPARALRRRAHRRRQAAAPHPAPTWPSSARRTPSSCCSSGGWCGPRLPRRGGRRADRARAGRPGHEQPQHLPHRRPTARSALCAVPGAAGRRGGRRRGPAPPSAARPARCSCAEPLVLVDYLVLVHPTTLEDVPEWYRGEALLAVAARVGTTRLIDNLAGGASGPGGGALEVFSRRTGSAARRRRAPAPRPQPAATVTLTVPRPAGRAARRAGPPRADVDRRRLRHRRPDRGAAAAAAGRPGAAGHQDGARRGLHRSGRRAASPRRWTRPTRREEHLHDTLVAGAGRLRRGGGARPGHRGARAGARARRASAPSSTATRTARSP